MWIISRPINVFRGDTIAPASQPPGSRLQEVQKIVLGALPLTVAERATYVTEQCGADGDLLREVNSLLAQSGAEFTSILSDSVAKSSLEVLRLNSGDKVGPYRIRELLGDGGMGSIYLADQLHPIRREVALKVIKAGMDTEQVVRRFEAERQVLTLMDHPNVAKVLDAGATESGRPYFVMEVVRGVPIQEYCRNHDLSTADRLRLLISVCAGVQHAHVRGVLHRDLKSSNILVDEQDGPQPKIIDFGIAKAQGLADAPATLVGTPVGTLEYMSPEQADGCRDLDTRTDVYALGVILFELLTNCRPFEIGPGKIKDTEGLRLAIRGETPIRPSQHSQSAPLASELDWITLKALAKERDQRYGSAAELGEDLARYLANKPVLAIAPTASYRLRKLMRRNRFASAALALTLFAFLAGGAATTWQAIRVTHERDRAVAAVERANRELEKSDAIQEFLVNDFLSSPHPELAGRQVKVADLLDNASLAAAKRFAGNPMQEAVVRTNLGQTYAGLGLDEEAEHELQTAAWLYESLGKEFELELLTVQHSRIHCLFRLSRDETGLEVAEKTLADRTRLLGPEDPATLETQLALAGMLFKFSRISEADSLADVAYAGLQRQLPANSERLMGSTQLRAELLGNIPDRRDEASLLLRDLLAATEMQMGKDSPRAALVRASLATALLSQDNRFEEAEALLRRVIEDNRRLLGPTHYSTVAAIRNLATTLGFLGRSEESETQFELCIELAAAGDGKESFEYLFSLHNYASVLAQKKSFAKADSMGARALSLAQKVIPNNKQTLGNMHRARCVVLTELAQYDEAIAHGDTATEYIVGALGPADWQATALSFTLARCYNRWGKSEKARQILEDQYRLLLKAYGPANSSPQLAVTELGLILRKQNRHELAAQYLLEYEKRLIAIGETGRPMLAAIYGELTRLYDEIGQDQNAAKYRKLSL